MEKENITEFINLIGQLSQEDIGNLLDYAIELKKEELGKSTLIDY